jgi:hypothetical protein
MRRLKWMLVCVGLGALSSAALAFQESKGGVANGNQPEQPEAKAAPGVPSLDLKDTGVSVAPSTGVEVRIPGLGKLGVLPKFDFGLELLYGANEKAEEAERQGQTLPGDDVQIRGSLRHRF